jgi:hypothetical protein
MTHEEMLVTTALTAWSQWIGRASKFIQSISDEDFHLSVAPGKNRILYIVGHLIAVNDSMIPQLRLGEAGYSDLREIFVTQPDGAAAAVPTPAELRQHWQDLNVRLAANFAELTPAQWLERHSTVSEEDFASQPHRNRLAILLSRTSHVSYHLGQLILLKK